MFTENINSFNLVDLVGNMSQGAIDFLNRYEALGFWVSAIALLAAVVFLILSIYGKTKKNLEDSIYIVFNSCVILIAAAALLETLYPNGQAHDGNLVWVGLAAYAAYVSLPAVYYLHVWSQVNYKKIGVGRVIGCFLVPGALVAVNFIYYFTNELGVVVGDFVPNVWTYQSILPLQYSSVVFIAFFIVMTVKSLLLCFNVFYQMSKHMRGSTRLLISAITVACCAYAFAFAANNNATFMITLIALIYVLERTYAGFFRASASNVIATSREFVFSNLSTMVIILSRKGRVLEWNRSKDNFIFKLRPPKYRQPFNHYRTKLIESGAGVVSKHDENVITLTSEGKEHHIMITHTPIKEDAREFGQLIEIADITNIYSVLSYLESIASFDHLTELYNRNAYLGVAKNAIRTNNLPLLIIVGDVNNLKLVNDNIGHIAGDRLLVSIAAIIREFVPAGAFAARIGGDEFVIIVPNSEESVAEKFAEDVRVKTQDLYDDEYGKPDISFGWAVARSMSDDYNEVFKKADQMMYREKKIYKAMVGISLSGVVPGDPGISESTLQSNADVEGMPVQEPEFAAPAMVHVPESLAHIKEPTPTPIPKPGAPVPMTDSPVNVTPVKGTYHVAPSASTPASEPGVSAPVSESQTNVQESKPEICRSFTFVPPASQSQTTKSVPVTSAPPAGSVPDEVQTPKIAGPELIDPTLYK